MKVGRWEKEINKRHLRGRGHRGAGLRPGQVSPGQESSVPEKQDLHQSSWAEWCPQGVRAGPQEGRDALRLPGTLTDTCDPGESAELPKGMQHAPRPGSSLEGLGRRLPRRGLHGRERESNSADREHWAPGHSPGSSLLRDRQRPGVPRTARTRLPRAEQISGPAPEPPGPADRELRSSCGS